VLDFSVMFLEQLLSMESYSDRNLQYYSIWLVEDYILYRFSLLET